MMKKLLHVLVVFLFSCFVLIDSRGQELPDDFPAITTIKTGETGEGYIFLSVSSDVEGIGYYVMMIDDRGQPFKYKKLGHPDYSYDFKVQPNGLVSYAQFLSHHTYSGGGNCIHMVLDEEMIAVDSFQLQNGYIAEAHDFQILPNGHVLAFGYYMTEMDLSDVVEGGYPNAMVSGGIIQELDQDKQVVWQWRSWDHYDKETHDFGPRGAANQTVSQFHLNTINLDRDDNILLATPSFTKKIDRKTGEILWHLGGYENEFSFVGVDSLDGVGDVTGHAFYRLENGNFLIYDNGPRKGAGTSEAHEYKLDEVNLIAEKIMTFTPDTAVGGWHRGNAQRLSNGNTLVGWGGATGSHIPTCTEFDSEGNTVLKVYFDHAIIESYRAVRFPYPPTAKYHADIETIALGNTYELRQGDTIDIGVKLKVTNLISAGYNELYITTHDYAPRFPQFAGRAPMVLSKRVVMDEFSINAVSGEIYFDAELFQVADPENITVYYRQYEASGAFIPLPTTYNQVTGEIKAEFYGVGEFIFTYPDIEHMVHRPYPVWPADHSRINYQKNVQLEWTQNGFFNSFSLQVATDSLFSDLLTDITGMRNTIYEMSLPEVNSDVYWRVKTLNDAGESRWSDTAHFAIRAPYIEVVAPNGNEVWSRGLDYFIEWEDNIDEEVVLELYNDDDKVRTIDTVESRTAFRWSIPPGLDSACNYHIRISSSLDSAIQDVSQQMFSINDSSCTGAEVPYLKVLSPNGGENLLLGEETVVEWINTSGEMVSIELYKSGEPAVSVREGVSTDTIRWIIPSDLYPGNDYRLVVRSEGSGQLYDMSNGDFKIVEYVNTALSLAESVKQGFKVYPNPAQGILTVEYTLGFAQPVTIKLYSLSGQELGTIQDESMQPGTHTVTHGMENFPAGSYMIRFISGQQVQSALLNHIE
jgi:hypothetical protein